MNSNNEEIVAIILMALGAIALIFVQAFLGLWIWNWIMPIIFGLPELSFWQFWGLCFLSEVIFPHSIIRKKD